MRNVYLMVFVGIFTLGLSARGTETCGWVGSDAGCRDQAVGSLCAREGSAGVCAIEYWDHCKCVAAHVVPHGVDIENGNIHPHPTHKALRKIKRQLRRLHRQVNKVPPSGQKCSWVGSTDSCREKGVGTYCAKTGKAGVCAITHWDHCDCALLD